ncbi:MAG: VanZ family protein [Nitrosomonadales bacterium]|nr:VanZ family protein [Nitrosomonadales bacterium]
MKETPIYPRRALLRRYLAAGYALFILYASLSPFSGWREQGLELTAVLVAPLMQTYTPFDATANLLAYLPFGLLLGLSLRAHLGAARSILLATLGGVALSAAMEYAQMYLPSRTSSNLDLLTNGIGSLAGALLAVGIAPRAWFALYPALWRLRLFHSRDGTDFGLALVALWIFAQINPSLPMLGNVFISDVARPPFAAEPPESFNWLESIAVSLNLLMLGLLLLTLLRARRHAAGALLLVLCAVALAKFVAAAALLKSWALLLWLNGEAMLGIFAGVLLLAAANRLPRPQQLWFAALAALAYLVLAHGVLDSGAPSAAMRLYQWHYGHLLNYNGLSQTAALAFPLLLLGYLWRIAARRA